MTHETYDEPTGWVGWSIFAGFMMILGGALNALYGFVALLDPNWVVFTNRANVYINVSSWGWIHLIIGLIVLAAGFGVLSGRVVARTIGVIVVGLSMIANFFFIPVYPFWAIIVIVIDALIIWALIVHGGEMRQT